MRDVEKIPGGYEYETKEIVNGFTENGVHLKNGEKLKLQQSRN